MRALSARAKDGLAAIPRVHLKTNREPELSGGVIKFRYRNRPTQQAYNELWTRHRLAIAITPAGDAEGLRISPQIYNSFDEIDRAVAAVRELA